MKSLKKMKITVVAAVMSSLLTACAPTISFQNISTHGSATDLVDENQSADAKVDAKVSAPLTP